MEQLDNGRGGAPAGNRGCMVVGWLSGRAPGRLDGETPWHGMAAPLGDKSDPKIRGEPSEE
eukprot:1919051-Alexandrium_andersonii.AAC.1